MLLLRFKDSNSILFVKSTPVRLLFDISNDNNLVFFVTSILVKLLLLTSNPVIFIKASIPVRSDIPKPAPVNASVIASASETCISSSPLVFMNVSATSAAFIIVSGMYTTGSKQATPNTDESSTFVQFVVA